MSLAICSLWSLSVTSSSPYILWNSGAGNPGSLGTMPKVSSYGEVLMVSCRDVLYENSSGATYNGQSKVVISEKDARYFAMVLLHVSATLLLWGWYGLVLRCSIFSFLNSSPQTLAVNSAPLSVRTSRGGPNVYTHFSRIASLTVEASLLGMGTSLQ